jgi:hypothetical protein
MSLHPMANRWVLRQDRHIGGHCLGTLHSVRAILLHAKAEQTASIYNWHLMMKK